MRRRTRLRKLARAAGLDQGVPTPAGPPAGPALTARAALSQSLRRELEAALRAGGVTSARATALAADPGVLEDARVYGVQDTARCVARTGLSISDLRERVLLPGWMTSGRHG